VGLINPLKMTDSKYFTTTKKGEIFELKSELNNDKKEKKKEAVKKVYFCALAGLLLTCNVQNL
jgi:AP-1 complex subunit beta-1